MAAAYCRLLLLRRISHAHHLHANAATHCHPLAAAATAALVTQSRPSATERVETPVSTHRPGFTSDGNFKRRWYHKLGSSVGAVLIGHAAFFLGLSNSSAFAQEDAVRPVPISDQAEGNATGLQPFVLNEHMTKWKIFMENGEDFLHKNRLDEAEKVLQAALLEAKEGFGPRNPFVAGALNALAKYYLLKGDYEKAELLQIEALEILEELFGCNDTWVGKALHNLGLCYLSQRKLAQAQTCFERALKIEGCVEGVGHQDLADTMVYLAQELMKSNRYDEAEIWQRKILHTLELSKGWESLDTIHAAEVLSANLKALDKLTESEELLERCLAIKKKVLCQDHYEVADTLEQLASLSLHKLSNYHMSASKYLSNMKNVNEDVVTYCLTSTKQLINDSMRITEGILNSSCKDQNKLNRTSTTDGDKIAATNILLKALLVVGAIDIAAILYLPPGGPSKDYGSINDALHKCISLYREPQTRGLVTESAKQNYMECLRVLIGLAESKLRMGRAQATELQELLGEARRILKDL